MTNKRTPLTANEIALIMYYRRATNTKTQWEATVEQFYQKAPKHYRVAMTLMIMLSCGKTSRGTELLLLILTPEQAAKLGSLITNFKYDQQEGETAAAWFSRLADHFKAFSESIEGEESDIIFLLGEVFKGF